METELNPLSAEYRAPPATLTEADRHRVIDEWNATLAPFPHRCAHELFEEQVARAPLAIAVTSGSQSLTYRELNERANQVAHDLRRRGVGPDTLVGVSMHRSPQMVIALLGIWKAGGAYVPIDPTYPAERLAFMVEDAAVHLLLTDANAESLFPQVKHKLICLDSHWGAIDQESRANLSAAATPTNLAYVIYTSGSTGRPKGALIQHDGLVNYLWWAIGAYGVRAGDVVPVHSSISFDLTITSLYPALLAGGRAELLPEDVGAQSLIAALQDGRQRGLVKITPAHLELLTQRIGARAAPGMTRAFIIGGENLTAESLRFWRDVAPATRLINEYGPTETVVGCCVYEVRPEDPPNGSIPIGRPIANTELYVLDESLQPVPIGEMGELYIGGAGVARGYLNRPELTRERFLPDSFSGRVGARLYKTGDLARYRPNGILEYLGRADNQVKIHGYRIELGEIETTLAGQPGIRGATVLVHEQPPGNKRLVAYVVPLDGSAPSADDMRRFLRERLPDYMVPSHFMFLSAFPLTQNGKVDRGALPVPNYNDASRTQEFIAPSSETEKRLATIWGALLKLDHVGVHDDFFDLGASSLMVVAAVAQIEAQFGVALELQTVFENSTTALLAAALEKANPARQGNRSATANGTAAARTVPIRTTRATPRSSTTESHVNVIRFGLPDREMVGLYHVPAGGQYGSACCILCNPFGQEAVRSHRVFRILAERLAASGFHVLRFDYFGTGDSAGDDALGDIDGWTSDILQAHQELLRRSGARRSVWLGLKLGGTLAALASARANRAPDRLVLWEPITDGAAYLDELANAHVASRKAQYGRRWEMQGQLSARAIEEARTESLGHPLTPLLREQLGKLAAGSFEKCGAAVSLFTGRADGETAKLGQDLERAGIDVSLRTTASDINWLVNDMLADSTVPTDDIRSMLEEIKGEL